MAGNSFGSYGCMILSENPFVQQIDQNRRHDCTSRSNVLSFQQVIDEVQGIRISSLLGHLTAFYPDSTTESWEKRSIPLNRDMPGGFGDTQLLARFKCDGLLVRAKSIWSDHRLLTSTPRDIEGDRYEQYRKQ